MEELLLPLFPLELVLFPEERLPLHIFEERYRLMVRHCLGEESKAGAEHEFGIVLASGQEMRSVGCTARIAEVARRYDDGRMDIIARGLRRFEILFTDDEMRYLRAGVEFFDDDAGADVPSAANAQSALNLFLEVMKRLPESSDAVELPKAPYQRLSFRMAAPLPLEPDFKQQLLAMRNEDERLSKLNETLRQMIPRLDWVIQARAKVGGNGHLRPREKQ
jgi:Lon protease-like protein